MQIYQFKRREFIGLIGGAAAVWPLATRAQQPAMPVIGFLSAGSPGPLRQVLAAFREGLRESGYAEGQNVAVEYRFAEGRFDRLPGLASELVGRRVAVIVVSSNAGALAVKRATTTIPIIFSVGDDPISSGLVDSLNRPGGNLSGVYQFTVGLEAKRLGLLREMVPATTSIAVLVHESFSGAEAQLRDVSEVAARLGVQLLVLRANSESDLNAAFSTLAGQRAQALLVCASPFFYGRREQLVVLAARHAMPAMYEFRDFVAAGGLMSYGTRLADAYRQAGVYAGRVLRGAKPADLPVVQATRFELVINISTAKALDIAVPAHLSAQADEVIE